MDISVGRLNNRMALQVPSELPLGLVFITGRVEQLSPPPAGLAPSEASGQRQIWFELVDEQHRLACRVPQQVVEETQVERGDRIRVSGHLLFDPRSVHYYLLARDLEVLPTAPAGQAPVPATVPPATKQQTPAAALVQRELPAWVKQLAPPEVQEELGFEVEPAEMTREEGTRAIPSSSLADERQSRLTPEMIAFLSSAIDSDEDIELTREMIEEYLPEAAAHRMPDQRRDTEPIPTAGTGAQRYEEEAQAVFEAGEQGEDESDQLEEHFDPAGQPAKEGSQSASPRWLLLLIFILILVSLLLFFLLLIFWNPLNLLAIGMLLPAGV